MGTKLLRFGLSGRRRGRCRAAALFVVALALVAGGCGEDDGTATDSEKAADVAILDAALAQELTLVDAYTQSLPLLRGSALGMAQELRGQNQAHIDALTKAVWGLGGKTEAEASELEVPGPRDRGEAFTLLYEAENAALTEALDAPPRLYTPAPRTLTAALATSHAQHLVLLRRALGAPLAATVPEPFEPGDLPPPGAPAEAG